MGFMVMNAQRIAMSIAIVCMVNQTAIALDRMDEVGGPSTPALTTNISSTMSSIVVVPDEEEDCGTPITNATSADTRVS